MKLSTILTEYFRANVRRYLDSYGWNQDDLANAMGVTKGYISQVLGGHLGVGLPALEKFAAALEVEPAELLKKIDAPSKTKAG